MAYKLTMHGIVDYDHTGFGRPVWGQIVLRENIPKITTARILACRYSKQHKGTHYGADIHIFDGNKAIEKLFWKPTGCISEKTTILLNTLREHSPVMHFIYDVNARDGTVKLKENYQRKW